MQSSRLLVIGAGPLQVPAIEAGKRMGLEILATDMDPEAPGAALADCFFPISTIDLESTVRMAMENRVDAVMTMATDFPMRTVAAVVKNLGLAGVSPDTADVATNKYLMRRRFAERGVPSARFALVASAEEALTRAREIDLPVVLKPTDRSGSAGVSLCQHEEEISPAFTSARKESRAEEVLVEEFIEGDEISVETMSCDGHHRVVAITDKLKTPLPWFVEMGHCVPADFDTATTQHIHDVARDAAEALGVTSGPTHTEMKVHRGCATVIELGARLGGDRIASHLVPLATGVDLVEASVRVALGTAPDLEETAHRAAAIRYLTASPGCVAEVRGVESARALPGVECLDVEVKTGDLVRLIRSSNDRPGWVIAVGDSSPEAIQRAEAARDAISIVTVAEPRAEGDRVD